MKILLSAAEISSDIQAEACIRALIQKISESGETVEVAGIGGPKVRSLPNFHCIENAENLRVMGFTEVLSKIPFVKKTQDRLVQFAKDYQPDLYITFDFPDFHLRLTERIHHLSELKHTLKICAIPPKVWVWRKGRVKKIRRIYDGVLVIFPFERDFYRAHGIPVIFEGNPLASKLPFGLSASEAQERLGCLKYIQEGYFPLSVFPGSRKGELKQHLPVIAPSLELTAQKTNKKIIALVPIVSDSDRKQIETSLKDSENVRYLFLHGSSTECLRATKVGLIKSGTSTLEAVLLGVYPVIFYKISWLSSWIFRIVVRYSGPVGLPNILLGIKERNSSVFPELLGPDANPDAISNALASLIDAAEGVNSIQEQKSKELKKILVPHSDVSEQIARSIYQWIKVKPKKNPVLESSVLTLFLSTLWSSINWTRRRLLKPKKLPIFPSVLVGNLQAGGAGKTPILKALALDAVEKEKLVAVLSRGYGGTVEQSVLILPHDAPISAQVFGDEVAELQKEVPSAVIGVGPDRLHSAKLILKWAEENQKKVDLVLVDDGFQNLKFKTDYTVLCVTDRTPAQKIYRDFSTESKFADLLIGTKGSHFKKWEKNNIPFFKLEWTPQELPKIPIHLLCALGDPDEVQSYYQTLGVNIVGKTFLPDHSVFDLKLVQTLLDETASRGVLLAVTEKDFMKLKELGFEEYTDKISTLLSPTPGKIAVLRRQAAVKELFKRILAR